MPISLSEKQFCHGEPGATVTACRECQDLTTEFIEPRLSYERFAGFSLLHDLLSRTSDPTVTSVTPEQAELIRQSFDAIWPVRRKLAAQFYRRFFELAPDAEGLFRRDMERQRLKLMDMIAAIVGTLDKREMFQSIISYSGLQHARFGAKPLHFAAFGDALIWGLEQQFGTAFSPEIKEAWIKLYDEVQSEMIRAGSSGKQDG